MTRLLVSVRDSNEARVALAAGVDLLDLKEPSHGALAPVAAEMAHEVVELVAGRVPVSAALGELTDFDVQRAEKLLSVGPSYAKLGLAGCARIATWRYDWQAALSTFPAEVECVAVVYADWRAVAAPSPSDVLEGGIEFGCRALLIDTSNKSAGNLLDHWPLEELATFVEAARRARLLVVLGGSLGPASIEQVMPLRPDYIAVRGAACSGSRAGRIDGARIEALQKILQGDKNCLTFR